MNTICSCITKLKDVLEKNFPDLRLPFERRIVKEVHTKTLTRFTSQNISIANVVETTEKSQVNETLRTKSTIHVNHVISRENTQFEKATKIGVEIEGGIAYEKCVGIDNSQMDENTGETGKKQRQLTCDFCQKTFNHTGDLNKHRRKHTGEQP